MEVVLENEYFMIEEITLPCKINSWFIFSWVFCSNGFQCMLTVSILIILNIVMMTGFSPGMCDVIVR